MTKTAKGIIASPGIKIGKAYIYKSAEVIIPKYNIVPQDVDKEILRFETALNRTKEEIKAIQEQIAGNLSKDMSDIFTSHLMILEDPLVDEKTKETIRRERRNVEWVLNDITLDLIKSLASIQDDYLRERIIDITDINKRLINNLQKTQAVSLSDLNEEVIIFSKDLTPSDTAMMNKKFVLAFVTDRGGRTSHTAIMARALEIPAIVGTINATSMIKDGDTVIVDAIHGEILINPTEAEIEEFNQYQQDLKLLEDELSKLTHLPSKTLDDTQISIYGNIEIPDEMEIIKEHGAQGIGLFRSEFLFLDKSLPDEEKQLQEYRRVVEYYAPLPVVIRTLDVGGDKIYAYTKEVKERNPFLGCRAIRFSLENEELFRTQIRAILRASHYGNVKMMFPMISTVEELIKARGIVQECMEELSSKSLPFNQDIQIGIMIEVPSAVLTADLMAKYADFFSIGTNDLVQYTRAVDRISEKIAYLYNPLNISILRFLKQIITVSRNHNIPVSICGEMAGEPKYTMVLLGLGFRNLSMSSSYMYQIKRIIRSISLKECEELVEKLMTTEETSKTEGMLLQIMKEKFSWLTLYN